MIDAVKSTGKKGDWKNINLLEVKKIKIDKVMIPINKQHYFSLHDFTLLG